MSTALGLLAIAFVGWTATTLLALFIPERGFQTGIFGHFMAFLILGFMLFTPWFVGSAFIIDHTMTNEQKFGGQYGCADAEESMPVGEVNNDLDGSTPNCALSVTSIGVYFLSGIGMYICSWVGSRCLIAIWPLQSDEYQHPKNNTITFKDRGR